MDAEDKFKTAEDITLRSVTDSTFAEIDGKGETAGTFEPGQLLDGKYQVVSFLGKGGMGTVYRVKQVHLGIELALKTLESSRAGDASATRRFQTEAKAAFSLQHPSLVKVHDYGLLENVDPFLVMDLVNGKSLQSLLKERGRLTIEEIEPIFAQLCFALAYAHQRSVVHRDIKPANIMIVNGVPLRDEGSVKLLDFGIVKIMNEDRGEMESLTQTGEIFGSPLYMSPEQCSGGSIDSRSDVYSLGCVLFEMLTGTPPIVGSNALRTMMMHVNDAPPTLKEAALGTEFPEQLENVVLKMLAKSPSDRYSDLGVAAHELSAACAGKSIESGTRKTHGKKNQSDSPVSFWKTPAVLTSIKIMALLAIGAAIWVTNSQNAFQKNPPDSQKTSSSKPSTMRTENFSLLADDLAHQKSAAKEAFEKIPIIASVDLGERRTIAFPEVSIGQVGYHEKGNTAKRALHKEEAQGEVNVPRYQPLTYLVSTHRDLGAFANPFVFKRIEPSLFTGLEIEGTGAGVSLLIESDEPGVDESNNTKADQIVSLLNTVSAWKNLADLRLTKMRINGEMLNSINHLRKLKTLSLQEVNFDSQLLVKQGGLDKLINLVISHGTVSPVFQQLSHSPNVRVIDLGKNCKLSADAIESLGKTDASLKILIFRSLHVSPEVVTASSKLRNVAQLAFPSNALNKTQLTALSKNWTLVSTDRANTPLKGAFYLFERKQ